MTAEEILLRRLAGQHLLFPSDTQTVVKDLCGVQAQFLSHALHGLSIRCHSVNTEGLIKSWTNRGTMHLLSADDLPLFLHQDRSHFLRPVDTLGGDAFITASRKEYFAELILEAVARGIDQREDLKALCRQAGMTESESKSLFDPWGGTIRALCEAGRLCHKVQETRAYRLCPPFEPMSREAAQLEMARRYFTHFGPATLRDAAYFFGAAQAQVKKWLNQLPVTETVLNGKAYFYGEESLPIGHPPKLLFLAGFDQFLLGYDKTESLTLPKEHLRDIFTLSGMVRPAIWMDGRIVGWWNLKNRRLSLKLFEEENHSVTEAAHHQWPDLKSIAFL